MQENVLDHDSPTEANETNETKETKEEKAKKDSPSFLFMFRELLNLQGDMDEERTTEDIKRNIDFRSGNAWMLVFAIFIASIGLNTNSTAVIIGAMLISPLMGPIVGAGLALGTNDFELLKRSLKSLTAAVVISVITSTLYFLLTPIQDAQSELLARTRPTVFDVLIAIFGGAAGIIAASRQERGNAIPGVAIATALMPPLCTAGYGLARGFFSYFLGAFYLFIINCVFISFSTFLFVRYLNFSKVHYLNKEREKKLTQLTAAIAIIVFIPSVFLAFTFIEEASFRSKARTFLQNEFSFPNSYLVEKEISYNFRNPVIKVTLIGEKIDADELSELRARMGQYDLAEADLVVKQSTLGDEIENRLKEKLEASLQNKFKSNADSSEIQIKTIQAELAKYQQKVKEVEFKELELAKYQRNFELSKKLMDEVNLAFPKVSRTHITFIQGEKEEQNEKVENIETIEKMTSENHLVAVSQLALVHWKRRPTRREREQYEKYLKARLENPSLLIWEVH